MLMKRKKYTVERFFVFPDKSEKGDIELQSNDIFNIRNKLRGRYLENMGLELDNDELENNKHQKKIG